MGLDRTPQKVITRTGRGASDVLTRNKWVWTGAGSEPECYSRFGFTAEHFQGTEPSGRSGSYLWEVSGVQLLRDGGDVVLQELEPLLLEADLVHVDVHGRHVLVAAGEPLVLTAHKHTTVSRFQDSKASEYIWKNLLFLHNFSSCILTLFACRTLNTTYNNEPHH